MKLYDVKINGIVNPMGFSFPYVSCSWKVCETVSKKQQYARIEVSQDSSFAELLFMKEGEELKQAGEALEIKLKPRTRYHYRIFVEGDAGDKAVSDICWFETGKRQEAWQAEWITPQREDEFHPVFEKGFTITKAVRRARLYITGVGLFEASLNRNKLGEEYLTPYINHYESGIQTFTYAVDDLAEGENQLHILLGEGWYMGTFGLDLQKCNFGSRMAAIAELHIEYVDGSKEAILSDESWHYRGSDIVSSGIYDGEVINRLLWANKENPWKKAEILSLPEKNEETRYLAKNKLMDRISIPVIVKETMPVKEILTTPAGEVLLDFGQNFAGFVEIHSMLPRGTEIRLECAEILQQGNFYHKNYRDAKAEFVYLSDGTSETIRPHFTFFGFRYIRVTGWPGVPTKEDFTGCVLYSDLERTGYLHTSNEKINRLYENTLWGLKSNFIDMPTDCPQRSEKLGWTGDAQVFSATASYHMDTRAFYHKFLTDLRGEQLLLDGAVPNYFPNFGHKRDAGSIWGDVASFVPDVLYRYFSNADELHYHYALMKDWVDYIDRKDEERGKRYLFDFGFHFGDWLALDGVTPDAYKGGTDDGYLASVYYYRSTQIVRQAAELLGKKEDVANLLDREEKIYKSILNEYFTPNGRLSIDTQAAYVVAIHFRVYINKDRLVAQFKERLKKDCYQIKCGFAGAPLLCTALAEAGEYRIAYDFLFNEGFPGWLYAVNMGATTVWERWNSVLPDGTIMDTGMNSLNHYAYGSVMEFVYGYAAGIRPAAPGFLKAWLCPHPDIRLREMEASYDSANGKFDCNYRIEKNGKLTVWGAVPFNAQALLVLPECEEYCEPIQLDAGDFSYTYNPKRDFRRLYGRESSLIQLGNSQKAVDILCKYVPGLAQVAISVNAEFAATTLEEALHMPYFCGDTESLEKAIMEIETIQI